MFKFSDIIEEVSEFNTDLKYGLDDIIGVTIEKGLIPTVANLAQTALNKFYIVRPNTFIYNPRTHGVRLGMGFNETDNVYITSWNNVAFKVKKSSESLVLPKYLWLYFLRPDWDRLSNFLAWGSSTIVFSWTDFLNVEIALPSIETQRQIVAEYNAIQTRIETNKKLIATLEQTAQTLYRHTFVDNINPNNLPKGWRMGKLGDVCSKLGSGATPKGGKESYCQEGISLIRSTNVLDFQFLYEDLAKINEEQARALDGVTVESRDVLFNITGVSVARCCMVPEDVLPARVNQHVMIVRPSKKNMSYYLLCTLCYPDVKNTLLGISQAGSTREAITKDEMEKFKIVLPADDILQNFDYECSKIFERKNLASRENQTLTQMQTLLLSKMGV